MKKQILFWLVLSLLTASAGASGREPVRNLIYLIGDGMGLSQVAMLQTGCGDTLTSFDRARGVALIRTRSANSRVTDSAAAATALASGAKTANGMVGIDPEGRPLPSMMARARRAGMAVGIAVTCGLQHATPAAFYAHVPDRNDTLSITRDLLASGVDVLFGGGRKTLAEECPAGGSYLDAFRRRGYLVADSLAEADTLTRGRVLCVVADGALPAAPERGDFLPRATRCALRILSGEAARRDRGFLLMVEGSQIDWAGHANDAAWMQAELRDFDRTVAAAMEYADRTPGTLVVVTADHETGGLSIPSCEADFTRPDGGVDCRFSTGNHTATMVPVYLYGTGADRITGVMDNTELALRIMALLELE